MEVYTGRLASGEDGNLLADETVLIDQRVVLLFDQDNKPLLNGDGEQISIVQNVSEHGPNHGRPVIHDLDAGVYRFLEPGEASHNEVHGQRDLTMSGTSGPLFDINGDKVTDGDAHHFQPLPDDPHFDRDAPNLTRTVEDENKPELLTAQTEILTPGSDGEWTKEPERGNPQSTGHTEAYVNA